MQSNDTILKALASRRSQTFLRKLRAALDELEDCQLIHGELEVNGKCCAMGVYGRKYVRGFHYRTTLGEMARASGVAAAVMLEVMCVNDSVQDRAFVIVKASGPLKPGRPDRIQPDHTLFIDVPVENANRVRWKTVRDWVSAHILPVEAYCRSLQ